MFGLMQRCKKRGIDELPEIPEDGLYVKVGIPHSDDLLYWLARGVKSIGVDWMLPEELRETHELQVMPRRENVSSPHSIVLYVDIWKRERPKGPEDIDYRYKGAIFDEREPGAMDNRRWNRDFVVRLLKFIHQTDWRKATFFEHRYVDAFYSPSSGGRRDS